MTKEIKSHVQSVDDALIGGLSYKLKASASYVSDCRKCMFSASGGNSYSSTGVKVCKFNIVSDQWLDPNTFRVMFTLNNSNTDTDVIKPLHWNPAVLFRRCRVSCGGAVIEVIVDYNRLSLMLAALKPVDEQKDIAMQGFGLFDRVNDSADLQATDWNTGRDDLEDADERKPYRVSEWDEASEVKKQRTVLFKPMLGILDQDKLIPLRYAPLQHCNLNSSLFQTVLTVFMSDLLRMIFVTKIGVLAISNVKRICSHSIQVSKMNMQAMCFLAKAFR